MEMEEGIRTSRIYVQAQIVSHPLQKSVFRRLEIRTPRFVRHLELRALKGERHAIWTIQTRSLGKVSIEANWGDGFCSAMSVYGFG